MKEIVLNEKSETVIYFIASILKAYCEAIYDIYEDEPEIAMGILLRAEYSSRFYDVLITDEIKACSKRKALSDINLEELKRKIMYWHEEHIIALVLKNITQNETGERIYWKLKMTVNKL